MSPTRLIELREWEPLDLALTAGEIATLQRLPAGLSFSPSRSGHYVVTPSSIVGAISAPQIELVIRPKVTVDRFFYLLGYHRRLDFLSDHVGLEPREHLLEGFVAAFASTVQQAVRRGLPQGYYTRDEALPSIRGRVRHADQFRRRFGIVNPIEVRYDDYTTDIEVNRLVKAAIRRCTRLPLRSPDLRRRLHLLLETYTTVEDIVYNPYALPKIHFNRLNRHFEAATELAHLVLRNTALELQSGRTAVSGLLFNMNEVFEDFVFRALGDHVTESVQRASWRQGKRLWLDTARRILLRPDLSLWMHQQCCFVGDAKYKRTAQGEREDLYQLLAYCTATALPHGLLVYADAPSGVEHHVVHGGPSIIIDSLDLGAPLPMLRANCKRLADQVLELSAAE